MTTYVTPGERVVFQSTGNAEPESGTVIYDDPTGFVFVDYGAGRVLSTPREHLKREAA